jgi:3,4-dihydroxy 2-butanone 4-phosphate synthase/GTP cyclohydrolase II
MFTGIVDEIGTISNVEQCDTGLLVTIQGNKVLKNLVLGESICVNGVCLTVIEFGVAWFKVQISHETLSCTTINSSSLNQSVNLEAAVKNIPNKGYGGHFVSGHVDGVGQIVGVESDTTKHIVSVQVDAKLIKLIIDKGFITINGISLTVLNQVDYEQGIFRVMLIDHTKACTVPMQLYNFVNLEIDLRSKHIVQESKRGSQNVTTTVVPHSHAIRVIAPLIYEDVDFQIGIVFSEWNSEVVNGMKAKCLNVLCEKYQLSKDSIVELAVPGAFEIPAGCQYLLESNKSIKAIITLGCLLKGETWHMENVANSISPTLQTLAMQYQVPIIYGVLTCLNIQQAIERIGSGTHHAESALQMIVMPRKLRLDEKVKQAFALIRQTIDKMGGIEKLPLSFSGGKDCLVVLHLLKLVLTSDEWNKLLVICFVKTQRMDEAMISYLADYVEPFYQIKVRIAPYASSMKLALNTLLEKKPNLTGMFMGQRLIDPAKIQNEITYSDKGWPPMYRINPILEWSYYDVWAFIYMYKVRYFIKYDQGYSSLGEQGNVNPFLLSNNNSKEEFKKPWMLLNAANRERLTRNENRDHSVVMDRNTMVENAIRDLQAGKVIILQDDPNREDEGDFICAASLITAETMNFIIREGRGLVCLSLDETVCEQLHLTPAVTNNRCSKQTAFMTAIDVIANTTTGISAADRAATANRAVHSDAKAEEFISPGHLFPLKARNGGLATRRGHTEGSVDLMKLAGLPLGAVICEIMNDDGTMARTKDLHLLASKHNLAFITITDIINYQNHQSQQNQHQKSGLASLPSVFATTQQNLKIQTYYDEENKCEQVIVLNNLELFAEEAPLVRIHSQCLTGDTFGSLRCDCGPQLQKSLQLISESKSGGALIYLTHHEGRGIGLKNKIESYILQDTCNLDTIDANVKLGLPVDDRSYQVAIRIIQDVLKWRRIRLLTNNPEKIQAFPNTVTITEIIPLSGFCNEFNQHYIHTKRLRLNHTC